MSFEIGINTMSTETSNSNKIVDSWSLMAFARGHGRMRIVPCTVKNVEERMGEKYMSCVFINPNDPNDITWVNFSRNLGELTPEEIAARKDDLQVVKLDSGSFSLCKVGALTNAQEVDLGL